MPSSDDSAGHNPSRVSIENGMLKTHKFSTVKNEITAKNVNVYTYIYYLGEKNLWKLNKLYICI